MKPAGCTDKLYLRIVNRSNIDPVASGGACRGNFCISASRLSVMIQAKTLHIMERPGFDKDRHINYWQRCLKSLLPNDYTSTDSSRVLLGFFILSALDILGVGVDT